MTTSAKLTIFEGPDGSGKTTAAKQFAELTDAHYVHCGPYPHVSAGLARLYVEAMMPAVLGHRDVVMDRSWLSEQPYGNAFRHGEDRLTDVGRRMLERLALRCGAVVVICRPSLATVKRNFQARARREMLDNDQQLEQVYQAYENPYTALSTLMFDYEKEKPLALMQRLDAWRSVPHPLNVASAGDLEAQVVLVGEAFTEVCEHDPLYQWPFASFGRSGCSWWLTEQLCTANVPEHELLWVNADQDLSWLADRERVIALGKEAAAALRRVGIKHVAVSHPQYWKRFEYFTRYPLLDLITN